MPVTVKEALNKGFMTVKLPSAIIFVVFGIVGFVLTNVLKYPGWLFFPCIGAGLVLSAIYWYVKITKWRIWAYENVDHIHEFEQKAINAGYIKSAGSISDRLAVKTDEDKYKLEEAQKRFEKKDVYDDDLLVPDETFVYFSKNKSIAKTVIGAIFIGLGIYFLIKGQIFGTLLTGAFGGFIAYRGFGEYSNREPQITLNAKGMETARAPFFAWNDITNERVFIERRSRSTDTYLRYDSTSGEEEIDIGEFNIDTEKLEHLMHVYRTRSEKTHR